MNQDPDLAWLRSVRASLAERLAAMPREPLPGRPGRQHGHSDRDILRVTLAAMDQVIAERKRLRSGADREAQSQAITEELASILQHMDDDSAHAIEKLDHHPPDLPQTDPAPPPGGHLTQVQIDPYHAQLHKVDHPGDPTLALALGIGVISQNIAGMELLGSAKAYVELWEMSGATLAGVGRAVADSIRRIGDQVIGGRTDLPAGRSREKADSGAQQIEAMAADMERGNPRFEARIGNLPPEQQHDLRTAHQEAQTGILVEKAGSVVTELTIPERTIEPREL